MKAIKVVRKFIEAQPDHEAARVLASLVLALESEGSFELSSLYTLDMKHFELALEILKDWRLDRYYEGKARLFDLSWQVRDLAP